MAWPDSADAVITAAGLQSENINVFVTDVMDSAESVVVESIGTTPVEYVADPDWVDPGDGTEAPQIPSVYDASVRITASGAYSAAVAEKLMEVWRALGANT